MPVESWGECKVSAWTSAAAFVVTTQKCRFIGVSFLGSAAATTLQIFDGKDTAGKTIAIYPVGVTSGGMYSTMFPIICTSGIVATNIGTMAGYNVYYK
jgi:hypothetical protein